MRFISFVVVFGARCTRTKREFTSLMKIVGEWYYLENETKPKNNICSIASINFFSSSALQQESQFRLFFIVWARLLVGVCEAVREKERERERDDMRYRY